MLSLGGSVPDVADGLHRHRLLNGLAIGMPPDHGHAMLWAPVAASNTRRRPFPSGHPGYVEGVIPLIDPRRISAVIGAVTILLATGCGAADDAGQDPTATDDAAVPTPPATTPPATMTSVTSAAPDSTSATTPAPSTTAPAAPATTLGQTATWELPIPSGDFDARADADLFVLTRAGNLELWSGALTTPGPRTVVADYPDPYGVVTEGPGPNVIDDVAGEVGGSIVFGDCCEPISGNVIAAVSPGDVMRIGGGFSPTLSPTGDLLGTANDALITQTSADARGEGESRQLNQGTQESYLNVRDLTWSSNATAAADDDHLVLLGWNADGWSLYDVDRSTLEPAPARQLGVPPVSEASDVTMQFAGHGPNSEIVVAQTSGTTTRLRYFADTTLDERTQLERSLPGSASSIRLGDDGLGLLWVDDGSLYHLPAGELGAERLGTGVLAAWFVRAVDD